MSCFVFLFILIIYLSLTFCQQIDIPLSVPFYKWLLNRETQLYVGDLEDIDPTLAKTIIGLDSIARKRKELLVSILLLISF